MTRAPASPTCCPDGQQLTATATLRYCPYCGTRQPPWPIPEADPDEPAWTASAETALRRALSDVHDGHLGLWDTATGITADRPVGGLRHRDWIGELQRRGWIERHDRDPRRLHVTPAGLDVVAAYRSRRGLRHGDQLVPHHPTSDAGTPHPQEEDR